MYATLYNRLTGWVWASLGLWGLISGTNGDYIQMTGLETALCLLLGWLGMLGARMKHRNQLVTCAILTVLYIAWMATGSNPVLAPVSAATPLEWVLRFLSAAWGIYCLGNELLRWRARWMARP